MPSGLDPAAEWAIGGDGVRFHAAINGGWTPVSQASWRVEKVDGVMIATK
jgi:hypothetical protein